MTFPEIASCNKFLAEGSWQFPGGGIIPLPSPETCLAEIVTLASGGRLLQWHLLVWNSFHTLTSGGNEIKFLLSFPSLFPIKHALTVLRCPLYSKRIVSGFQLAQFQVVSFIFFGTSGYYCFVWNVMEMMYINLWHLYMFWYEIWNWCS